MSEEKILNQYIGSINVIDGLIINYVDGNWIEFTLDGYRIQAKAFATPSKFGLKQGRISKLVIYESGGKLIYSYDRGPAEPSPSELLQKILNVFSPRHPNPHCPLELTLAPSGP